MNQLFLIAKQIDKIIALIVNGNVNSMELFDLHLQESLMIFLKLSIALILAIPVAWRRGIESIKNIGIRTFPIVSIASCGFVIIAKTIGKDDPTILASTIQGMLSGIGFIGGGAILKQKGNIHGIVTAASIWNTGAIGISIGTGELIIGMFLSLINFLALFLLTPVKKQGYFNPENGLFNPTAGETGLLDKDENKIME